MGTPVTLPPPPNVPPTFPTTTTESTTTCPSITTICPNVTSPVTTTSSTQTTSTATQTTSTSSLTNSTATSTRQFTIDNLEESVVDIRLTSKYRRSLTSAVDNRPVSLVVGYSSAVLIFVPFALIVLSDLATLYKHFRDHETLHNVKKKVRIETNINESINAEGFHLA